MILSSIHIKVRHASYSYAIFIFLRQSWFALFPASECVYVLFVYYLKSLT